MKLRWQIVLPFGHLIVDCVILCLWLLHAHSLYHAKADSSLPKMELVLLLQEGGSVTFFPRFPPPEALVLLASGTLPTLLVSDALRPEALVLSPNKLWDPTWFLIHETVSFILWFAVGVSVESGLLRIKKSIMTYLVARAGFASFSMVYDIASIGWRVEVLAWFAFGAYLIVVCLRWVLSKVRRRRATI